MSGISINNFSYDFKQKSLSATLNLPHGDGVAYVTINAPLHSGSWSNEQELEHHARDQIKSVLSDILEQIDHSRM